jgi:predicted RNA polymerase sigma factor
VPLPEQDRARWDRLLIRRGLDALARREALAAATGPTRCRRRSPRATRGRARRGHRLAADRRALRPAAACAPSPVVELNRAVAHSMAFGPEAGLALIDAIANAAALRNYARCPRPAATSCSAPVASTKRGVSSSRPRG